VHPTFVPDLNSDFAKLSCNFEVLYEWLRRQSRQIMEGAQRVAIACPTIWSREIYSRSSGSWRSLTCQAFTDYLGQREW